MGTHKNYELHLLCVTVSGDRDVKEINVLYMYGLSLWLAFSFS